MDTDQLKQYVIDSGAVSIVDPEDVAKYADAIDKAATDRGPIIIDVSESLDATRGESIFRGCYTVIRSGIPGHFAEFGTYRGETARGMCRMLDGLELPHKVHLFDTFTGLPDPHPQDLPEDVTMDSWDHHEQYAASIRAVESVLKPHKDRIILHKGLFSAFLDFDVGLSFAHIDADLYEGTRDAITICNRVIHQGGIIIIDDYGTSWRGVQTAVDEFLDMSKWGRFAPEQKKQFIAVKR